MMLSFTPPYQRIGGYTLLPDHEAEQVRYVLPFAPQLSLNNSLNNNGIVDFSLVQYLGGGTGSAKIAGGLLTFSAELVMDLEALRAEIRDNSAGELVLQPVLFDSGIVELIALGTSSVETPGGRSIATSGESDRPLFNLQILGSGKPTLDVTNRVSFQLLLDANGAELVEKLLETPDLPLLLIYRMQMSGLRPSYSVTIEADWQKLYSHLNNRLKVNAYYAAADVELAVEKALEENQIAIDTTVFGSGESERQTAAAARRQLLDWVMERMFQPLFSTEPTTAATVVDAVDGVLSSLVRTVVPGVSYRLRSLSQEQIRHFHIRLDETIAERREIVPQGTLGGLFRQFQLDAEGRPNPEWPALRQSLVTKVNLNGFPRLEVEVGVEDRFASDGISRIETELRQPSVGSGRSLTFRSATERHPYIVNLLGAANPFDQPYEHRTTVYFDPAHPFGPHAALQTDWQTGRAAQLYVEPRGAYQVEVIQVSLPPTFQFETFAAVAVVLSYGDQTKRLVFQDSTPQIWQFRHFEPERPAYQVNISYLRPAAANAKDIVLPMRESTVEILSLPHPAPDKRNVQILVELSLEGVRFALLELRYADEPNGITFSEQIDLLSSPRFISRVYNIADGGSQELSYRLTLLGDKGLIEGEWRKTEDTRLIVAAGLLANRVVTVRSLGGSLMDNRLKTVRIQMQQRAVDSTVRAEHQIVWEATTPSAQWEFGLGDPPIKEIYAQVTFVDLNGFARRLPWQKTSASNLIIHLQRQVLIA